jgi:hypothetical protein
MMEDHLPLWELALGSNYSSWCKVVWILVLLYGYENYEDPVARRVVVRLWYHRRRGYHIRDGFALLLSLHEESRRSEDEYRHDMST